MLGIYLSLWKKNNGYHSDFNDNLCYLEDMLPVLHQYRCVSAQSKIAQMTSSQGLKARIYLCDKHCNNFGAKARCYIKCLAMCSNFITGRQISHSFTTSQSKHWYSCNGNFHFCMKVTWSKSGISCNIHFITVPHLTYVSHFIYLLYCGWDP